MREHRLVGWWLAAGLTALALPVRAQSTAAFPADTSSRARQPPPTPPPAARPPARRAPSAPPPGASRATRAPRSAPVVAPSYAASPRVLPRSTSSDTRPPLLPYRDGLPVPPGYTAVKRPATGLIAGGLVGLGVSYGAGFVVGAAQGFGNASGWLVAPFVGPWVAIAERKYAQCSNNTTQLAAARRCVQRVVKEAQFVTFVAVDGVFQLATGLVTLAGLMSARDELVRDDLLQKVSLTPPLERGAPWTLMVRGNF